MDSLPCDVVLLPEPTLAERAMAASRQLQHFNSLFVLENGRYYPHASLYMFQLKVDDISKVKELLSEIASSWSPLQLPADRYNQDQGYIDVEYQKTPAIVELQKTAIAALNPIRTGMRDKDKARLLEATGLALENLQEYGYRFVGELFRPHLTLTRLPANNDEALAVLDEVNGFSGAFPKIGLFEMGDNGTAIRQLAAFEFHDSQTGQ